MMTWKVIEASPKVLEDRLTALTRASFIILSVVPTPGAPTFTIIAYAEAS
jgi:hypothetical protein